MVVSAEQERVKTLLRDTITLLCKNGLSFTNTFSIEAVIGVTLDQGDVFLMSMNEVVKAADPLKQLSPDSPRRKRKRVKRSASDAGSSCSSEAPSEGEDSPQKLTEDVSETQDVIVKEEEPWESKDSLPDFSTASFSHSDAEASFGALPGLFGDPVPAGWVPGSGPPLPGRRTATVTTVGGPDTGTSAGTMAGTLAGTMAGETDSSALMGDKVEHTTEEIDPDCLEQTSRKVGIPSDVAKNESEPRLECTICEMTYQRKASLAKHMRLHHTQDARKDDQKYSNTNSRSTKLYCDKCDKSFRSATGLSNHYRCHENNYKFLCSHCGKGYNYKTDFKIHVNSHTGVKPHQCVKCAKFFASFSNLVQHKMGCGVTEKRFSCETCSKSFKALRYLKEHRKMHTEPRKYQCALCGACLSHRASLLTHMRKHKRNGDH